MSIIKYIEYKKALAMVFYSLLLYIKRKIGGIKDYTSFTVSILLLITLTFQYFSKVNISDNNIVI